jgi:hypothetical protein
MRYAPGKVPARPLPAAPSRPTIQQQVAGTRPVGAVRPKVGPFGGFSGDPKPAMTGLGSAMQNNPRMAQNLGGMGGRPGLPMMKKGGKVSSASKRADGIAVKGKTKGKMV